MEALDHRCTLPSGSDALFAVAATVALEDADGMTEEYRA
jgi:hypothetical protein